MHKWWAFVIQQSLIMYPVKLASPVGLRIQRKLFLIFLIYHRHLTTVRDKHRNLDWYTKYVLQFQVPIIHSRHRGNSRYRHCRKLWNILKFNVTRKLSGRQSQVYYWLKWYLLGALFTKIIAWYSKVIRFFNISKINKLNSTQVENEFIKRAYHFPPSEMVEILIQIEILPMLIFPSIFTNITSPIREFQNVILFNFFTT